MSRGKAVQFPNFLAFLGGFSRTGVFENLKGRTNVSSDNCHVWERDLGYGLAEGSNFIIFK
jgi:hypothetical protein